MTGWIIAFALATLVLAGLIIRGRLSQITGVLSVAALFLGLAGYAWQGHPGMAGAARIRDRQIPWSDQKLTEERLFLGNRLTRASLMIAELLISRGRTAEAVNILELAIRTKPADADLWVGLANALSAHGNGLVSPAADYAYRHAIMLAPTAAAPRYYYGLALAGSGDLTGARRSWATLIAMPTTNDRLKNEVRRNIGKIDEIISVNEAQ